jgi:hypothetical protein
MAGMGVPAILPGHDLEQCLRGDRRYAQGNITRQADSETLSKGLACAETIENRALVGRPSDGAIRALDATKRNNIERQPILVAQAVNGRISPLDKPATCQQSRPQLGKCGPVF